MNANPPPEAFVHLRFDNRYTRELPADPELSNHRRQVTGACYSRVRPAGVARPRLIGWSPEVAALLGLDAQACEPDLLAQVFSGNLLLPGMDPHATCYGGHQFGRWAGQLGDGRAINLGEVVTACGGRWTLQLKGAGPTPYSRGADGLAVLRSSLREFIASEAMHHLGVPTTRALSLVLTGEDVLRDMFYDGNARPEPGAIVCRVAPAFTRFGHFEILAARGDTALLERFAAHTVRTDFPHLGEPSSPRVYAAWFDEVCRRTLEMVVHWMRVGFVHGVMNTDNMSILGQTIDYGPYGWLEGYDPEWTPNTTDAAGRRYAYGRQPQIALWNLARLADAIQPLVGAVEPLEDALRACAEGYLPAWQSMMAQRLGLRAFEPATDAALLRGLFELLAATETDLTIFHRQLARVGLEGAARVADGDLVAPLREAYYSPERLPAGHEGRVALWVREYGRRAARDGLADADRQARMDAVNPRYVPRNYLAQIAIDAATGGDYAPLAELLDVLRRPYEEQPGRENWAAKRPEWARHRAGCSMLSCSS